MKKHACIVLCVIACALIAACLVQIVSCREQLRQLDHRMNTFENSVRSDVSNISAQVHTELEQQASLISDGQWAYDGPADFHTQTVPVRFTVTPKTYDPQQTRVRLMVGQTAYPLTYADGVYQTQAALALFEETPVSRIELETQGTVQTEALHWYIFPRYELLPMVYANFYGHYQPDAQAQQTDAGTAAVAFDGTIEITADWPQSTQPLQMDGAAELLVFINDQLVKTLPVSPDQTGGNNADNAVLSLTSANQTRQSAQYSYQLCGDFEAPFDSTLTLAIEITDAQRLRYRCKIESVQIQADGACAAAPEDWQWRGAEAEIYDHEGTLLYACDPERYW